MTILESISLFPYTRLWRIGKETELSHSCGGIASILLMIPIVIAFIYKLIEVFSRSTIQVSTSNRSYLQSLSTNVTTSSADPFKKSIMIGLYFPAGMGSGLTASAYYNNGSAKLSIPLQTCTSSHFSMIPNGPNPMSEFPHLSNALCLPVNQSYVFGGKRFETQIRSELQKTIIFDISCPICALGGSMDFFMVSSILNPYDITSTWQPSLYRKRIVTIPYEQRFYVDLIQNQLNSHNGLFPIQNSVEVTTGHILDKNIEQQLYYSSASNFGGVKFIIGASSSTIINTRYFLTILDILSYMGGIFSFLLSVFIFMPGYSAYYFQLYLAKKYLKTKEKVNLDFCTYVKDELTSFLKIFNFQTNSEEAKIRNRLRNIIDDILNVLTLQKRIEFLQKSLTVLLEQHQLKGLHLINSNTVQQIETNLQHFKLKKRLLSFLKKKRLRKMLDSSEITSNKKQKIGESEVKIQHEKKLNSMSIKSESQRVIVINEQNIDQEQLSSSQQDQSKKIEHQLSQLQFQQSMESILQRLFSEAKQNTDIRSQIIFQKLDPSLKELISRHLQEKQETENQIFHYNMVLSQSNT